MVTENTEAGSAKAENTEHRAAHHRGSAASVSGNLSGEIPSLRIASPESEAAARACAPQPLPSVSSSSPSTAISVRSVAPALSYKAALTQAMTDLARDPARIFVGYGLSRGRAMGTLRDVPESQILETPVAENLMVGLAIGLALQGRKPVVYFERADFLLNALDAIVNHVAPARELSRGEFSPAVILRITVGNKTKPLFTGPVHTQDFAVALRHILPRNFQVFEAKEANLVSSFYDVAAREQANGNSSALFEYKDLM